MRTFETREDALSFVQTLPWGNAAGCCKNEERVRAYSGVGVAHLTYGSITALQRNGNPGDNFGVDFETGNALNAWGIPDPGIDYHLTVLPELKKLANKNGSELWVSISAGDYFDPKEYYRMARRLAEAKCADGIESNKSCPNMIVDGKSKPVVCYDLPRFEEGVAAVKEGAGLLPVKVKIAPITEASILGDLIDTCVKNEVEYIVMANTVGNCYIEKQDGTPLITMGRGGLSGPALRPLIRGMLQMAKPRVAGTNTKLIAVGGIESGADAYDYLRLGAHGFAFNTVLTKANYDPAVIEKIILGNGESIQPGLVDILFDRGLPD